jgi:long-chain acyl-CoA synthetase
MYKNFQEFVASFSDYGDRFALVTKPFIKTEKTTYKGLQQKIYQIANYLTERGVKKGDRVMIVAPNSSAWVQLFLGCQVIGAILVPVDARNSLEIANSFKKQTTPKLIFRSKNIMPELESALLIEELEDLVSSHPCDLPKVKLTGKETAVVVFTSGTTAKPKGAELTQQNILSNVEGVQAAIAIDPNWRVLSVLPLSHMYELTGECCMLSKGTAIYYLPMVAPLKIVKALNEYKITTILAVPQLLIMFRERILQIANAEGQAGSLKFGLKIAMALPFKMRRLVFKKVHKKLGGCLGVVITGGAPIPLEVGDFWERLGVITIQGYGLTETGPILTVNHLDKRRTDSQGLPLNNLKIRIAKNGEIQTKGPNVFKGYWKKPIQTAKAFTLDGWFKTGDIGHFDNEWLIIQGREKFAIVLASGMNVYPEDIETVAEKQPVFKEICVVGKRGKDGEEVFATIISDQTDEDIDKAVSGINARLESYQHITGWSRYPGEKFPRTLLLKVDRKNIQAGANNQQMGDTATDDVKGTGDVLLNIIRLSLNNPQVEFSETDRLADKGLDSLRRLSVVSLIEEQLGIAVDEAKIDQKTTLSALRKLVANGSHSGHDIQRPEWQYHKLVRFIGSGLRETIIRAFLDIWVNIKTEGTDNLKELKGPAIFIFNHVDYFDGAVIYQALPRKIRNHLVGAHASDVLEKHKLLKVLSRVCYGGYSFDRLKLIMPSLEYTAELIDSGWNVALAPEGTVSKNGKLQEFKSGIGLLAVETGAPVVILKTVGLYGTYPLGAKVPSRRSRVIVKVSEPIVFGKDVSYQTATNELRIMMERL